MSEKNLLDDIFNCTEEHVEAFNDAIKDLIVDPNQTSRLASGKPDQIQAPELIDQQSGLIRIQHGWHGDDYVLHLATNHPRRQFKVSQERVVYAIAKVMNMTIPAEVEVRIWLPLFDWQVKEYTFKCIDLKDSWNIDDARVNGMVLKLFEVLNTLV